jgi:hypothetical protein
VTDAVVFIFGDPLEEVSTDSLVSHCPILQLPQPAAREAREGELSAREPAANRAGRSLLKLRILDGPHVYLFVSSMLICSARSTHVRAGLRRSSPGLWSAHGLRRASACRRLPYGCCAQLRRLPSGSSARGLPSGRTSSRRPLVWRMGARGWAAAPWSMLFHSGFLSRAAGRLQSLALRGAATSPSPAYFDATTQGDDLPLAPLGSTSPASARVQVCPRLYASCCRHHARSFLALEHYHAYSRGGTKSLLSSGSTTSTGSRQGNVDSARAPADKSKYSVTKPFAA